MADDNTNAGAAAPAPADLPAKFEPGVNYLCQLRTPMQVGLTMFSPMHPTTFEGSFAESIRDNLVSAEKV